MFRFITDTTPKVDKILFEILKVLDLNSFVVNKTETAPVEWYSRRKWVSTKRV